MSQKCPSARLRIGRCVAFIAVLGTAVAAVAQDPWIIPGRPAISPNEMDAISICNGETFPFSEELTTADQLDEWVIIDDKGRHPIKMSVVDELELVSNPLFSEAGLYTIAASFKPFYREKEARAFERYLKQEEGSDVYALRVREGMTRGEPGREYVHRYAKLFLQAGDQTFDAAQKPVGQRYELVPLSDPSDWKVGDTVGFKLTLDGKPLAGHRVCANHPGRGAFNWASEARTNSTGVCWFLLQKPGLWYLRTHLIRPMDKSGDLSEDAKKADWETFYATVTFNVKPKNAPRAAANP